ncbi:MAG: DUF2927 domain-containing protein [Rubellimicrobium sp.]|nr:DUF2927 domain-containing protein [Rubellimicrobium sp.]
MNGGGALAARRARRVTVALIALLSACSPGPDPRPVARAAVMTGSLPPMQTFAPAAAAPPTRANDEIAQDFLDLAFRTESGRSLPVLTRFEGPVSVRVAGAVPPTLVPDLRELLDRLRSEAGIDIFLTGAPDAAITIEALPRAELQRAVPRAACFVVPRVGSWEEFRAARRTPQVDWATLTRRDRATVFVPADVAPQEIRDCLHEELSQALGPLNDLYRLPDSIFNDDNIHAVLTGFDMLVLRAYYAPELRNGMTRGDVAVRLPALLGRLNPAGNRPGRPVNDTSRDWIDAIETALSARDLPANRRASAELAVNLARAFGWDGPRKGFALYVYGRLVAGVAPDLARGAFLEARRIYAAAPETRLHEASVALQLAAFALRDGDAAQVLALTDESIPTARGYRNAALLAQLLMFRAEALALLDRPDEAAEARLDSLAWGRYGLGSDIEVRARQREIALLSPANRG